MKDLTELTKLSVPERLEIVTALWNSIVDESESLAISQELRDELDQRLEEHRKNPGAAQPWEQVEREIFGDE